MKPNKWYLRVSILLCLISITIVSVEGCKRRWRQPLPPRLPPRIHQLQVSRYTTSVLADTTADRILRNATLVLQANDGPGDMVCQVELRRTGGVTTFTTGNGIINSMADFNTIIGVPGNIKVVNQINWCGALAPNIIGCAPIPGNSLTVVRYTPNQEGVLWDHEFGHNKGLNHRNDPNAVMNGIIDINNRRVNAAECNAYRQ